MEGIQGKSNTCNNSDSKPSSGHRRRHRRLPANARVDSSASAAATATTTATTTTTTAAAVVRVDSATATTATATAIATEGEDAMPIDVDVDGVSDCEMAEADDDAVDRALPLPGSAMEVCTTNISVMTKKQLVDLCDAYNLPCSGNKPKLKAHLRAFGLDRKRWESLIPGARKHHKGPRSTTLAKKRPLQKKWMQRREQLFTATPLKGLGSGSAEYLKQLPTERSRDNRTHEEKMAVLEWAREIEAKYPYPNIKKRKDRSNVVEGTQPATASEPSVDLSIR